MKIEFLGTGGAVTIPRPLCQCRVCAEARTKGVPYSRSGPSLFVHGPDVLIDTPEDIYTQMNRSKIKQINAVFYSHWHPDHVMGRRVLESINADFRNYPPASTTTDVYLLQQVAIDFQHRLGSGEHLSFLEKMKYIRLHTVQDGDSVSMEGVEIRPFRLAEDYVYAFLFSDGEKRVLIAMDELNNWDPPREVQEVDVAVLPIGIFEFHPLTGERLLPEHHPVLKIEATFAETLDIIGKLKAKKTILTHIEEMNGLGFDDLKEAEKQLQKQGLAIEIAYDTMVVEV
jgi:phosphoribosyl 1,2-cyclic phosphate phosphodiesterase